MSRSHLQSIIESGRAVISYPQISYSKRSNLCEKKTFRKVFWPMFWNLLECGNRL